MKQFLIISSLTILVIVIIFTMTGSKIITTSPSEIMYMEYVEYETDVVINSWQQEKGFSEMRQIVSTVNRGVEIRGAIDWGPSYYLRIQENSGLEYIIYLGVSEESDGYGALIVHEDDTSTGYQLNANLTETLREVLFQID